MSRHLIDHGAMLGEELVAPRDGLLHGMLEALALCPSQTIEDSAAARTIVAAGHEVGQALAEVFAVLRLLDELVFLLALLLGFA